MDNYYKGIMIADRNYPVVQMVPVMDNTLYHHVRSIPSLAKVLQEEHCQPNGGNTASTTCFFCLKDE